ncbi:MAG: hypothetical protein QM715_14780 [Nibricoccus sp.]
MKYSFLSPFLRNSISLGVCLLGLSALPAVGLARESWPEPTETAKRAAAAAKVHEAEVWKRIEPELQAWAAKGKPYIPNAGRPGVDLPQATVPAFPGAEGAGAYSFGGRGGKVFVVTSLADSGRGTFREACEAAGPRIVVFNVAGIIQLESPVHIRAPYITIAGQTAPGDGVCIAGATTAIDTHDVVIRYMRFRRGQADVSERDDSLGGKPVGNIVLDHVSASWGFDENLSIYSHLCKSDDGTKDIKTPTVHLTIQWTISSEGLNTYSHGFGGTWGGRYVSFHHNLFACNSGRNPSIGWGDQIDFRNNVLFNWVHRSIDGGDATSWVNVVGNYFKPGPATEGELRHRIAKPEAFRNFKEGGDREGKWYIARNIVEGNETVTKDNWSGGVQLDTEKPLKITSSTVVGTGDRAKDIELYLAKGRMAKPFEAPAISEQQAAEAYQLVLDRVGATLPKRDAVDLRVAEQVRTGNCIYTAGKGIITDISQVGGYPTYQGIPASDLSEDGIPLWWKNKYKLDPHDPTLASKDLQGDGYTVIEKYLAGLDPTKKIDWTNPASNVNTLSTAAFSPTK